MTSPLVLPSRDAGPERSCALPNLQHLRFYRGARAPQVGQPLFLDVFSCKNPSCLDLIRLHHGRLRRYPNVYFLSLTLDSPQEIARVQHTYLLARAFNFAEDYRGEFFRMLKRRGVAVTPYALIFDGNGTLLWEGHPVSRAVDKYLARLNAVPIAPVVSSSYAITGPLWWRPEAKRSQARREEAFKRSVAQKLAETVGDAGAAGVVGTAGLAGTAEAEWPPAEGGDPAFTLSGATGPASPGAGGAPSTPGRRRGEGAGSRGVEGGAAGGGP